MPYANASRTIFKIDACSNLSTWKAINRKFRSNLFSKYVSQANKNCAFLDQYESKLHQLEYCFNYEMYTRNIIVEEDT